MSNHNTPSLAVSNNHSGFTLVEIMVVVAIIAVLAAFAYPNYQQYVIKTKRTDMMSEMQNIATQIESRKLLQGSYSDDLTIDLGGKFPRQGPGLYTITFTPSPLTSEWMIRATPQANTQVIDDGTLTLNFRGTKCRKTICGTAKEWND